MNNTQLPKYEYSYAKLSKNRSIFLCEDFTNELSSSVCALLLYYDNLSQDEITIYINSNGGDCAALFSIVDMMSLIRSPIRTICLGKAYSAGAFLLSMGTKGRRFMMQNSEVMVHRAQVLFPLPTQTQQNNEAWLDFINRTDRDILKIFSKAVGKSIARIEKDLQKEPDMYMSAKQAIDYGVADFIVNKVNCK